MISPGLPTATPLKASQISPKPESAFDLLMQGAGAASLQTLQEMAPASDPKPEVAPLEELDTGTVEGLMTLLDQVIVKLENSGGRIVEKDVLTRFAEALGETPVETVGELDAVAQLETATLVSALQDRIASALRPAIPMSQLSIASAEVTAVGRGAALAARNEAQGAHVEQAKDASPRQFAPAEITPPDLAAAKTAQPGQAALFTELAGRDIQAVAGDLQLPPELARVATTAGAPRPNLSPDDQLRQHVTQHIRTVDTNDGKFRFSLTPYGMGEIEIEILRTETGRIQIALTTETASVLNVLRHDREQLLDALNARGMATQNADLDFQTFGERGGREQQQQAQTGSFADRSIDQDPNEESAPNPRPTYSIGTLDILT